MWHYMSSLSQKLHLHIVSRPTPAPGQLWTHVPSDIWKPLEPTLLPAGTVVLVGISASFVAAWNFSFPTKTEKILWRTCSLIHFAFSMFAGAYYVYCEIRASFGRKRRETKCEVREIVPSMNAIATAAAMNTAAHVRQPVNEDKGPSTSILAIRMLSESYIPQSNAARGGLSGWRNISRDGNPEYTVSLRLMIPFAIGCFLYVICRIILYTEDFAGLRLQPAEIYVDVNRFLPFLS